MRGSALCVSGCETDGRVFVCVARLSLCISQGQTPPRTVLVSPLPASFSLVSPCPPEAPILQSAVTVLLGPASCQGPADPSGTRQAPLWSGIAFEAAPLSCPGPTRRRQLPPFPAGCEPGCGADGLSRGPWRPLSSPGAPVSALHIPSPSSPASPPPACVQSASQSVQSLSHVRLSATLWTATRQASLSITSSQSLLKLVSIELVMPSNYLILCHPLLLPPSIFPSIRVFSNQSVLHIRWPKYWSFTFNISPSDEYSGLISFRMDWLDLFAVQETLKSLLQHQSS